MKTAIFTLALALTSTLCFADSFECQDQSYSCGAYSLTLHPDRSITLENVKAKSATQLEVAGFNNGFNRSLLFTGAIVPEGMNILARVQVTIDHTLLERFNEGDIAVSSSSDANDAVTYHCRK